MTKAMRFSAACDTAAAGTASSAATAAALSHRSMVGFPLHHLQSSLSRSLVQGRRGRFNPGLYDGDLQMKKPAPDRGGLAGPPINVIRPGTLLDLGVGDLALG